MRNAVRALGRGAGAVLLAPHLIAVAVIMTMLAAAPFGLWLGLRLQESMPADELTRTPAEINPEWWSEYRRHATGLEATFTPAIVGFAAPLSNLSAVLDGTMSPSVVLPAGVGVLAWAFLWGGLLHRFANGHTRPVAFLAVAARLWAPFVLIALVAAVAQLALYLSVHRLLFGWLFGVVAGGLSEPAAVVIHAGFYLVFGACLATVTLVADYARATAATSGERNVSRLLQRAWRFVRAASRDVIALYLLTGMLFVIVFVLYGVGDAIGGSRVGGWRAIAIGQAYITARIVVRLIFGASEVRLLQLHGNDRAPRPSS